jgi:dethiobiotin synthetase
VAPPLVLVGTGTSVGKTHVAERLLRALAGEGARACGYKPIESGADDPDGPSTDAARLARASSFHVKPEPARLVFSKAVSAHLAAREANVQIDLDLIRGEIRRAARLVDTLVVELPGGAFSPLTDSVCAAEFARTIPYARVLLVASDRLGVLHDVASATRACAALGLPLFGVVLSAPELPDLSTGTNGRELAALTRVPVLAELPRTDATAALTPADPTIDLARRILGS